MSQRACLSKFNLVSMRKGFSTASVSLSDKLDTSKFIKNASFDRNFPKEEKTKAWIKAGEDKDTFFRKRFAHVHAKQKVYREEKLERIRKSKEAQQRRAEQESGDRNSYRKGNSSASAVKRVPLRNPLNQFIYGTSSVWAALSSDKRASHSRLLLQGTNAKDETLLKLAKEKGVYVENVDKHTLNVCTNNAYHNGVVLETRPLALRNLKKLGPATINEETGETEYSTYEDDVDAGIIEPNIHQVAREQIQKRKQVDGSEATVYNPFGVFIDEVTNPHNMGAILRSAYFLGADFVVITAKNSAPLNAGVAKTASGALDLMDIYVTETPLKFMASTKGNGWKFVSAGLASDTGSTKGKKSRQNEVPSVELDNLNDLLVQWPCVLVLGSEEEGIRTNILKNSDFFVQLKSYRDEISEGESVVDSLNVSVAGALLMHRFLD